MKKFLSVLLAAMFMTILAASAALAADQVGSVGEVVGEATVMRDGGSKDEAIKVGTPIYVKDTITTGSTGRVQINMVDRSRLMLGGKTKLVIREYMVKADEGKRKSILGLLAGKIRCIVDKAYKTAGSKFEVHTPTAVAGVMGTDFCVEVGADGTSLVITISGLVNFGGSNVGAGQQGNGTTTSPATSTAILNFVFATSTEADAAKAAMNSALALAAEVDAETDPVAKAELQSQLDTAVANVISMLTPAFTGGTTTTTTTSGDTTTEETTSEDAGAALDTLSTSGIPTTPIGGGGGGGPTETSPVTP